MRHALEPFDRGTREVAHKAAELTAAGNLVTVAGGGDTDAALTQARVADKFTYVSMAGGAFLEWFWKARSCRASSCCSGGIEFFFDARTRR